MPVKSKKTVSVRKVTGTKTLVRKDNDAVGKADVAVRKAIKNAYSKKEIFQKAMIIEYRATKEKINAEAASKKAGTVVEKARKEAKQWADLKSSLYKRMKRSKIGGSRRQRIIKQYRESYRRWKLAEAAYRRAIHKAKDMKLAARREEREAKQAVTERKNAEMQRKKAIQKIRIALSKYEQTVETQISLI